MSKVPTGSTRLETPDGNPIEMLYLNSIPKDFKYNRKISRNSGVWVSFARDLSYIPSSDCNAVINFLFWYLL